MANRDDTKINGCPKNLAARLGVLPYYPDPKAFDPGNFYFPGDAYELCRLLFTDSVNDTFEKLDCFWLLGQLASMLSKLTNTFYTVYVVKNYDKSFYLILEDKKHNISHCERHPYSNITSNVKLILSYKRKSWLLSMPSEK